MSIMNMPPLPYLARIPTIAVRDCRGCYTDPTVWDSFDPLAITACSPDPQAFRPPEEKLNVLQVRLATNFKAAPFASEQDNAKLVRLQADIEAVRFADMEVPVKLKVHESVFVPLAKWPMLIAGNYRCITDHGPRSIKDAVHSDLRISRTVYEGVVQLCLMLGADTKDLVPFEKYASAALTLTSPSSVARALSFNAPNVERVDRLVQTIGAEKGIGLSGIDDVVAAVDTQLRRIRTVTS